MHLILTLSTLAVRFQFLTQMYFFSQNLSHLTTRENLATTKPFRSKSILVIAIADQ